MSPKEQTVFRYTSGKGFDGLQAFKEPVPAIGDYEVLVKIHSVAINYRDIAIARGTYPLAVKDQVVPCTDMAGEVLQVSKQVDNISVGDTVVAAISSSTLYGPVKDQEHTLGGTIDGVLREYIVLPVHQVIKLPKSPHTLTQWSAVVATGSTVWNCFYGGLPLKPGQTVLIQGTGGVALTALIFARAAGATTIITSSSDEKLANVKAKYGADHTINYNTHPNWAAEVQRITNGAGVDHVIENGGIGTIQQSIECVAMGGTISLVGFLKGIPQDQVPDVTLLAICKGVLLRGILAGSKQQLEEAVQFVGSRNLTVPLDKTFAFNRDDIVAALQYVASGQHVGKVCIHLN
ncbi:Alcohol dehydrogenase GroES-like domain-containing protein [Cladophialophora immunda]|nr:Alcohol dehydrogenase GroES-like domain-containing protein [Cladophialophora immunda]